MNTGAQKNEDEIESVLAYYKRRCAGRNSSDYTAEFPTTQRTKNPSRGRRIFINETTTTLFNRNTGFDADHGSVHMVHSTDTTTAVDIPGRSIERCPSAQVRDTHLLR